MKAMQRDFSILGHGMPTTSASSSPSTGDHDYASSLHHSIFSPKRSPLFDYFTDSSSNSNSNSRDSEDTAGSWMPQIQQKQQWHQDLIERHQTVLVHLRDVANQVQALRQENVNLKMTNLDLKNRLSLLLSTTPFHGLNLNQGIDYVMDGLRKMSVGVEEEGTSENDVAAKSPTRVMDSGREGQGGAERVRLPRSISVRSSGYLKAMRAGGSSGKGGDFVKAPSRDKIDNETQKVYVKGGKEQALELEVYNQGMFKTELCNKWQQTGTCPYGDNCQFAHGIEELRPVLRHPRYKTEVCRMVLNGVPCPYGHRCHFRHALTEQEQLTKSMNSRSFAPMNYR